MLLFSTIAFAQKKEGTLSAEIYNNETGEPLIAATVQLYSLPDSVYKAGAGSDLDGKVNLKVASGKYLARISYMGCKTVEKDVTIESGKVYDMGKIEMLQQSKMLDDVVIREEVPPVIAAEDTLVFNTTAFRVAEGSMLEELIKKYVDNTTDFLALILFSFHAPILMSM